MREEGGCEPLVISISVMVCHLFMATNQVEFWRRQLKSMTSLVGSLARDFRTDCRRGSENRPEGKRKDVMMTYYLVLASAQVNNTILWCSFRRYSKAGARPDATRRSLKRDKEKYYLFSASIYPFPCILVGDAAADLQMTR